MIIRLDDASCKMDIKKWNRIENILDKYNVIPVVGIIPDNKDPEFEKYDHVENFKNMVQRWKNKNWEIAMHGCNHIFVTNCGGINPVNLKSEFAGLELEKQKEKIKKGYELLRKMDIEPRIFFAPAHTFDKNTINAIKEETDIRIISDTIANDIYYKDGIYFIPQQSGICRKLPFRVITYCYHPNLMDEQDFQKLEEFLKLNHKFFVFPELIKRKRNLSDIIINDLYFLRIKIRRCINEFKNKS